MFWELLHDFLSLKNDVTVASKSNKQIKHRKEKIEIAGSGGGSGVGSGSGSFSHRYGSKSANYIISPSLHSPIFPHPGRPYLTLENCF
jgi:hypothetical protein